MGKVFDEEDYERRIEQARAEAELSAGQELKAVITGDMFAGERRQAFADAKERALDKARAKILQRIQEEEEARSTDLGSIIADTVEEIANGPHGADQIVSVDG